jgi:hypothetical protein
MAADLTNYPWAIRVETHDEDWKVVPREEWGDGPWLTEPDLIEWRMEGCSYPLIMRRGGSGQLCGYVGVPPEHPFHRRTVGYPGVNFAGPCNDRFAPTGEAPTCWWFGFDCGWGYMPYHESFFRFVGTLPGGPSIKPIREPSTYVTVEQCKVHVEGLANAMGHWEESLRGVTTRDKGDGTMALIRDGKEILQMPDDVWEGFTLLGKGVSVGRSILRGPATAPEVQGKVDDQQTREANDDSAKR